jgi:hypothetical protein
MARIVPAKPLAHDQAVLALESSLEDDFIILQRTPVPGFILIAHPELGLCALACIGGERHWDADAEAWDSAEPLELKVAIERAAEPFVQAPVGVVAFLFETPRGSANQTTDGIVFLDEEDRLAKMVRIALQSSVPVGENGINALIAGMSPGASSYARGEVPEAQKRWRDAGRPVAAGPSPAVRQGLKETATAPASPTVAAPSIIADVPYGKPDLKDDDPLILLLRQVVETTARDIPMFVSGCRVYPTEVTETSWFLPALLVSAAEDWAPVVVSKNGKGGFHIRLRTDPDAMLGYRIVALEPSAPLLLVLPVINRIRGAIKTLENGTEEISLNETVKVFQRWLDKHQLSSESMGDIDLRIALQ